jgi:hypothetical protein
MERDKSVPARAPQWPPLAFSLRFAAALFFYWLRCRLRFWYGVCEIGVATVVAYLTFVPQTNYPLLNSQPFLVRYLLMGAGVLTSVYILVRGMDNMDQDLPPTWRLVWDRAFPKRYRQQT